MTPLTSLLLTFAQANTTAPAQVAPPPPTAQVGDASTRFSGALASALDAQAATKTGAVAAPAQSSVAADAESRARRALQLEGPTAAASPPGGGDAVLNGLQKLRGAFSQEMSSFAISATNASTTEGLYQAQAAAANFSLFMEVSSKLAGKASQAFESLLKGQ